ncbi:MAG: hypothetical protein VW600_21580, partial [Ferrovibrio sp.]
QPAARHGVSPMAVSEAADPISQPETQAVTRDEPLAETPPPRRQAPLAAWFGRLGIRARIGLGFGIALGLLVIVSAASVYGVQAGRGAFSAYDRITGNNEHLQQFERDMVDLRRNLLLFIERDDPRGLLATRRLEPKMTETLAGLIENIGNPQSKALLTEAAAPLKDVFAKLAQAISARNALKAVTGNQLDVYGPRARDSLMQLVRAANKRQEFANASEAGLVLDAFSEIRIAATRFVGMGEMGMANEARGKVGTFVDMIEDRKVSPSSTRLASLPPPPLPATSTGWSIRRWNSRSARSSKRSNR